MNLPLPVPLQSSLHTVLQATGLLIASNLFMTAGWYGHLKYQARKAWYGAALVRWGIAVFECLLQVPANRVGCVGGFTLAQLKITQAV